MEILVFDIETTDFLQKGGKIVEVGIVSLNLLNGEKKTLYDQVVYESGITLDEVEKSWIVANSTLTVDNVRHGKSLNKEMPIIQSIIDSYPLGITAFNNMFDFGFFENRGFVLKKKLPCPMKLSTDICKIPNQRYNGGGYKWPKVEEAHKFFFGDVGYVEQHRGADDAFYEADIVYELYKRGVFKID